MTDTGTLANRAVALKLLEDAVKEERRKVNAQLADLMTVGDRKTAALTSGTKVGSVTLTKGRISARPLDPATLTKWVEANHPEEIQAQVRPAYLEAILAASKNAGVPVAPDGEMLPDGAVTITWGEAYLSVRPEDDPQARRELIDVIRANQELALDVAS